LGQSVQTSSDGFGRQVYWKSRCRDLLQLII